MLCKRCGKQISDELCGALGQEHCSVCNFVLKKDAKYCVYCGAPVPSKPKCCEKCGAPLLADQPKYCNICGFELEENAEQKIIDFYLC